MSGLAVQAGMLKALSAPSGGDGVLRSLNDFTGYTNGALTVSSSGELNSGWAAWQAFDGSTAGVWLSDGANPWVKIDFGAGQAIYEMEYYDDYSFLSAVRPTSIEVESSDDNSAWTSRLSLTPPGSQTGGYIRTNLTDPVTARYWRVRIPTDAGAGFSGFPELRLYS